MERLDWMAGYKDAFIRCRRDGVGEAMDENRANVCYGLGGPFYREGYQAAIVRYNSFKNL